MDILFRAKRKDTKEWVCWNVFGQIVCDDGKAFNFVTYGGVNYWNIVDLIPLLIPETVGQWTGVKDEEGDKIFKGHIVVYKKTKYEVTECYGAFLLVRVDGEYIDYDDFPQSIFPCGSSVTEFVGLKNDWCVSFFELMDNQQDFEGCLDCKIVGSIHDNPELMEDTK